MIMVARRKLHFKEGKSNIICSKLSQEVTARRVDIQDIMQQSFSFIMTNRTGAVQQQRINSGKQDKHNQLNIDVRMDRDERKKKAIYTQSKQRELNETQLKLINNHGIKLAHTSILGYRDTLK